MPKGREDFSFSAYIKTLEADNIIIDKLTVGAYTARETMVKNDNDVTSPTAPPSSLTGVTYRGKFFPRGMRGNLRNLRIYCKRTGTGTLTLSYSPQPGMGPVGSVTITPDTDWNWKIGSIGRFWNYDSLFIWVSACDSDVSYGYDDGEPRDAFSSADNGVTWYFRWERYFIRAYLLGQTVGDIPVSGTINTIEIPTVVSAASSGAVTVPTATETSLLTIPGAGTVTRVAVCTTHDDIEIRFYIDGKLLDVYALLGRAILTAAYLKADGYTASTPQIQLTRFTDLGDCYFAVNVPLPFQRSFEVRAYHTIGVDKIVYAGVIYHVLS